MCEPATIGLVVAAAGTLIKAQAQAQAGAAAKTADFNSAHFANRAAADAVQRGTLRDLQVALRGSAVVADQRVALSGSGVDLNTGGALQTQRGSSAVTEVDRRTVRRNAALAAYGLRTKAQQDFQAGEHGEQEASNAELGTFLSGAGQVGPKALSLYGDLKSPAGGDFTPESDGGFYGG